MLIKINSFLYEITYKDDIDAIKKIAYRGICISEQKCGICFHYNMNGLCGADWYNDYCADRYSDYLCDCGKFEKK